MIMNDYHIPVLLQQSVDGLNINPDGVYVDVTFGGGGHSLAILNYLSDKGKLFAFDQDPEAKANLIQDKRLTFIPSNFKYISKFLKIYEILKVDGILADLGVSSHQLDEAERGFSTRFEADLDMRMNANAELDAKKVINQYSEEQLADVIYYYGEINNARKLASIIVNKRKNNKIETTTELIEIVEPWIKGKRSRYLAQLFQAIRIEVNGEIEALKQMLEQSLDLLNKKGRLVVISYHSIEDRIVKQFCKTGNVDGILESDLFGNKEIPLKMVNKKIIIPDKEELDANSRARSAKLRIVEKK